MSKKKKDKKKYDTAYLKAVEEINKDRINELKGLVKEVLEAMVATDRERKKLDEKMASLKLDLEDLKCGRIEKLKKRHEEQKQNMGPLTPQKIEKLQDFYQRKIHSGGIVTTTNNPGLIGDGGPEFVAPATFNISGRYALNDGTIVTIGDGASS